ncbi:MAG: hypothetical protein AAF074_05430 [Pseudomonadota bacterium]
MFEEIYVTFIEFNQIDASTPYRGERSFAKADLDGDGWIVIQSAKDRDAFLFDVDTGTAYGLSDAGKNGWKVEEGESWKVEEGENWKVEEGESVMLFDVDLF